MKNGWMTYWPVITTFLICGAGIVKTQVEVEGLKLRCEELRVDIRTNDSRLDALEKTALVRQEQINSLNISITELKMSLKEMKSDQKASFERIEDLLRNK